MRHHDLDATAVALVAPGKGVLAADESVGTMDKRLAAAGIPADADHRRAFRELIVTTPGLSEWISGVILFDETFRQRTSTGATIPEAATAAGLLPGIKVDIGAKPLAGSPAETVTEGLDGLRDRLAEYVELGARFAKWRAVIRIDDHLPSEACVHANAHALARYAALCQEAGVVPIVEPEVLMDGDHTITRCGDVTAAALELVFAELDEQGVRLEGTVLKPNMVVPGSHCPNQSDVNEVAGTTVECLRSVVPAAVPGIAFLSGGQTDDRATVHLNEIALRGPHPWEVTFSYGRGLIAHALAVWGGKRENIERAQTVLAHRARCNAAARNGQYSPDLEHDLQVGLT